ncbi:GntR family transcriptional regulator [Actinomadura macrotermitis]|uniref:Putative transcriptional regulator PhnF n=1 Tax=Actinomadura macrotermitis TaxID=2585200 RepID=A0A7K0C109_9ACTN|nr:GntR family transcriptional regulator [Actinomadura macrotermitis]MQY06484.1 putative transcriptional regulator PhnF [Actinomadura macrotermitis]
MSSLEFQPPKYARLVLEIRRQIEEGELRPGDALPSETQLMREFAVGRSTAVRALQILQQDGWITREHGRGSFVRGRPVTREHHTRPGLAVLEQSDSAGPLSVGTVEAPSQVAGLLNLDAGERVVMRRWLNIRDGIASDLVTCWFPPALVQGTYLDRNKPLPAGVREHLRTVKDLRLDHVTERLSARLASGSEAELLKISTSDPVLSALASLHDAADTPRFVVEVVMPGTLHELEDVYSVSD